MRRQLERRFAIVAEMIEATTGMASIKNFPREAFGTGGGDRFQFQRI
jgi:hypothetical protein